MIPPGGDIEEVEKGIEEWGDLKKYIESKAEEAERLEVALAEKRSLLNELELKKIEVENSIKGLTETGAKNIERASQQAMKMVKSTMQEVKGEIRSVQARALEVGRKVGKMEKILPSEGEVEGFFEFVSTPHQLAKNHPALFTAVNSLLNWVRSHEHELSYSERDRIRVGLEGLIKEITRKG